MTKPTEAQCQAAIIQAAKLGGWLVHAERPALTQSGKWSTPIQGHKGFPDLVLISPDHLTIIFAELKRKPNKVTAEQVKWLDAFSDWAHHWGTEVFEGEVHGQPFRTGGLDVRVVWVPDELDVWVRALASGRLPEAGE